MVVSLQSLPTVLNERRNGDAKRQLFGICFSASGKEQAEKNALSCARQPHWCSGPPWLDGQRKVVPICERDQCGQLQHINSSAASLATIVDDHGRCRSTSQRGARDRQRTSSLLTFAGSVCGVALRHPSGELVALKEDGQERPCQKVKSLTDSHNCGKANRRDLHWRVRINQQG